MESRIILRIDIGFSFIYRQYYEWWGHIQDGHGVLCGDCGIVKINFLVLYRIQRTLTRLTVAHMFSRRFSRVKCGTDWVAGHGIICRTSPSIQSHTPHGESRGMFLFVVFCLFRDPGSALHPLIILQGPQ